MGLPDLPLLQEQIDYLRALLLELEDDLAWAHTIGYEQGSNSDALPIMHSGVSDPTGNTITATHQQWVRTRLQHANQLMKETRRHLARAVASTRGAVSDAHRTLSAYESVTRPEDEPFDRRTVTNADLK